MAMSNLQDFREQSTEYKDILWINFVLPRRKSITAQKEVVVWVYIERDEAISKTRFDKNTNSVIGERVRDILLHAPKHIPGTRDGKPARFKTKLIQKFEAHRGG